MAETSLQQIELPITGITCASCVRNVERALTKADGVASAAVNIATERASVAFDPTEVAVGDLIQRVQGAGYGVATASIELPITGMTCASCVRNVERAVQKQPGVLSVSVNLATEKAVVNYLPNAASRSDLVKAVEAGGYGVLDLTDVEEPEDAERAARQAEIDHQRRLVIIGAIFSLPLFVLSMARDFYLTSLVASTASHGALSAVSGTNPALDWLLWAGWPFSSGCWRHRFRPLSENSISSGLTRRRATEQPIWIPSLRWGPWPPICTA